MRVIQATYNFPTPSAAADSTAVVDMLTERVMRSFYDQLDAHLRATPGGILLSPPKVSVSNEKDFLLATGDYIRVRMSATCEDLPEPPSYRLIGGPADGFIVRTRGERVWLVPVAPPPPSAVSYAEPDGPMRQLVAEYRLQGDSSAYFFERVYEQ